MVSSTHPPAAAPCAQPGCSRCCLGHNQAASALLSASPSRQRAAAAAMCTLSQPSQRTAAPQCWWQGRRWDSCLTSWVLGWPTWSACAAAAAPSRAPRWQSAHWWSQQSRRRVVQQQQQPARLAPPLQAAAAPPALPRHRPPGPAAHSRSGSSSRRSAQQVEQQRQQQEDRGTSLRHPARFARRLRRPGGPHLMRRHRKQRRRRCVPRLLLQACFAFTRLRAAARTWRLVRCPPAGCCSLTTLTALLHSLTAMPSAAPAAICLQPPLSPCLAAPRPAPLQLLAAVADEEARPGSAAAAAAAAAAPDEGVAADPDWMATKPKGRGRPRKRRPASAGGAGRQVGRSICVCCGMVVRWGRGCWHGRLPVQRIAVPRGPW